MTWFKQSTSSLSRDDEWFHLAIRWLGLSTATLVIFIGVFITWETYPIWRDTGVQRFFSDKGWFPAPSPTEGSFNVTAMLWGTLCVTVGAVAIAAPLGILSAVFCRYYAPSRLSWIYRRVLELLAGIPSVVYGLWGLVTLVPWINRLHPPGPSLLAGIILLTLMILPTIALFADAAFAQIPAKYLQGAAALGLSHATTVFRVALHAARSGCVTGILLATGRAVGETMAVLMVCGNVVSNTLYNF